MLCYVKKYSVVVLEKVPLSIASKGILIFKSLLQSSFNTTACKRLVTTKLCEYTTLRSSIVWLNTAAVNQYFRQAVKCSNTGLFLHVSLSGSLSKNCLYRSTINPTEDITTFCFCLAAIFFREIIPA